MSDDEEEGAKGWNLLPVIRLLHSSSNVPVFPEDPPPADEHSVTDPGDSSEAKPENGSQEVSHVAEGVPIPSGESVKEDARTAKDDRVAAADRTRLLKGLLLDTWEKYRKEKSNLFPLDLQRYDLDNGFRYPTVETEPGVQLEGPKTALSTSSLFQHPPFGHLGLISNGMPASQPLFASPQLFVYGPSSHGPFETRPTTMARLSIPHPKEIQPFERRTGFQRKQQLVMNLIRKFPDEAENLLYVPGVQRTQFGPTDPENEIHVFVDFSNVSRLSPVPLDSTANISEQILIGFFDTLKAARGIPIKARTRRVPFSFHSFTLILERGRPVAKKILVGSKPLLPAVTEAEHCGYEICVLDRVMKTREPTLRVRANGNTVGHFATSSSSEAASGPRRMVEQAVDEVLHLKILESVVDAKKPSTIVLASGDAAVAEYSAGFMRMVERALEKGWKVELASFSKNMSSAYRNQMFLQKWKSHFQIITLDSYVEELLDM